MMRGILIEDEIAIVVLRRQVQEHDVLGRSAERARGIARDALAGRSTTLQVALPTEPVTVHVRATSQLTLPLLA